MRPREQMSRIRASLDNQVSQIRESRTLSDHGRKLEMAKALGEHRKKAAGLREQFGAEAKARRKELHQRLFGLPSGGDVLAFRDAADRADQLSKAEDAQKMLERAELAGDSLLVRAITGRAHERGWHEVTQNHFADTPLADNLAELENLRGGSNSIGEAALFGLFPPSEIGTLTSDRRVEDFIANAEKVTEPTSNGRQYDPTGRSAFVQQR